PMPTLIPATDRAGFRYQRPLLIWERVILMIDRGGNEVVEIPISCEIVKSPIGCGNSRCANRAHVRWSAIWSGSCGKLQLVVVTPADEIDAKRGCRECVPVHTHQSCSLKRNRNPCQQPVVLTGWSTVDDEIKT